MPGPTTRLLVIRRLTGGDHVRLANALIGRPGAIRVLIFATVGVRIEHRLQVDQKVVENVAGAIEELEDLRIADRVDTGAGPASLDDFLGAKYGELPRNRGSLDC